METYQKLVKLEEYLGNEIRWIEYNLDLRQVSKEEYAKLPKKLIVCEHLHMQVQYMKFKALPF